MTSTTRAKTIIVATTFLTCSFALAGDRDSVGRKIGNFIRKADEKIQNELDRRPDVRNGISRGIDVFSDNLIDAVTPEADARTRRVQKAAVQMMLNPSDSESDRAFRDMRGAITDIATGSSGSSHHDSSGSSYRSSTRSSYQPSTSSRVHVSTSSAPSSSTSSGHSSQLALPAGLLAMGQADWHTRLWAKADSGLIASSQAIGSFLPKTHGKLSLMLGDAGLSSNAAATSASITMALAGLIGLLLLITIPRRGLKRKLRRLQRELDQARSQAQAAH